MSTVINEVYEAIVTCMLDEFVGTHWYLGRSWQPFQILNSIWREMHETAITHAQPLSG